MSNQNARLSNKVALVTGGARGIGSAVVKRLVREGAAVAFTYFGSQDKAQDLAQELAVQGGEVLAVRADSSDVEAVRRAVAETVQRFGRIDILINNAGIARLATLDEVALEDFDRMFAVNVKGLFVATQEAARHMAAGGRIINVGSVNSDIVPFAGASVYAMTKGAVASLTRGLARDLGPRGITVNNVEPGPTDTDMNPATGPLARTLLGYMAVQRYAQGDEIAAMIAYLAGPEASFVTGANLKIDGGFSA
jgi:3-oxoacyl-[acyl-carrier protein] reductase